MAPPTPSPPVDVTAAVRIMQVIAGVLIGGVVAFGVVAVVIAWDNPPGEALQALIGLGVAAVLIPLSFVVPSAAMGQQRRQLLGHIEAGSLHDSLDVARRLYGIYQTRMIIGMALLEGAAFCNLVFFLVTARWWNLAAAGILLLLMASRFPSKGRIERWVHDQLQLMQIDRA